jgi:hypothetical protein
MPCASQREKSARVKLSPQGSGDRGARFEVYSGRRRRVQRRGNLCTFSTYYERLLGRRIGDSKELILLRGGKRGSDSQSH